MNRPLKNDFYDDYQKNYGSTVLKRPIIWSISNKNNLDAHLFFQKYKKYIRGKLLEVGCAPAQYLIYFQEEYDCQIYGIDNSLFGILLSRKNLDLVDKKANLSQSSCFNLPFKPKSFNIIVSFGLIEHFQDPLSLLEIFSKFLKSKGLLITSVPNYSIGLRYFHDFLADKGNLDVHQKISTKQLYLKYKELGFTHILSKNIGIWIWPYLPILTKYIFKYNKGENHIPRFIYNQNFINRFNAKEKICIGIKK